jgi:hypothetical protein
LPASYSLINWSVEVCGLPAVALKTSDLAIDFCPLCCAGPRRWRHELRSDRIAHRLAQDPIDLGLCARIQPPARHFLDWLQLAGMARTPKRGSDALIEHPADRQLNNVFAETVLRQLVELLHGGKILGEPRVLELRVGAAEIVTIKCSIWPHPPRQQTPAECAISERRDLVC